MMKIPGLLIFLVLLAACYHPEPEAEFNNQLVIPADSMVSLLTDMHLAEGIITTVKDKPKPISSISSEYFDVILKKHQISKASFEESMRYYAYHAEEMDKIYARVITELSKIESLSYPDKSSKDTLD